MPQKYLSRKKQFVRDHKTALIIAGVAVMAATIVLMYGGLRSHDAFLEEKGLLDEYYTPEDEL